jgi:hypothetical protein
MFNDGTSQYPIAVNAENLPSIVKEHLGCYARVLPGTTFTDHRLTRLVFLRISLLPSRQGRLSKHSMNRDKTSCGLYCLRNRGESLGPVSACACFKYLV